VKELVSRPIQETDSGPIAVRELMRTVNARQKHAKPETREARKRDIGGIVFRSKIIPKNSVPERGYDPI